MSNTQLVVSKIGLLCNNFLFQKKERDMFLLLMIDKAKFVRQPETNSIPKFTEF